MEQKREGLTTIVGIAVSIVIGIISAFTQSKSPQSAVILFIGLLAAIVVFFMLSYLVNLIKERLLQLNAASTDIEEIKKDLNIRKHLEQFNIRLSTMENTIGKKGIIDPRWVVIIIMLILFYVYLRAKGII